MLAEIEYNRPSGIHFNQGSTNSYFSRLFGRPTSLLIPEKAIPCADLFREIAPTADANFDVCCNKTGDCQIIQDRSLNRNKTNDQNGQMTGQMTK